MPCGSIVLGAVQTLRLCLYLELGVWSPACVDTLGLAVIELCAQNSPMGSGEWQRGFAALSTNPPGILRGPTRGGEPKLLLAAP